MKKLWLVILISLAFVSCTKNDGMNKQNKKKWQTTETHIAVLFGYGYNDENLVSEISNKLAKKYGLFDDGGLILPLVYPSSFVSNGIQGRISMLSQIIQEKKCTALITLGAPENTHKALATIQDENMDCLVISLFSQDNILGIESGSYLVLDYENENSIYEESSLGNVDEGETKTEKMLLNGEEYSVKNLDKTENLLEQLIAKIQKKELNIPVSDFIINVFDSRWKVSAFLDAETGLRSANHYVIKYIEKNDNVKGIRRKK